MTDVPTQQSFVIDGHAGSRLDRFVCELLPSYSREQIKQLIAAGQVLRNGAVSKASTKLQVGDTIRLCAYPDANLTPHVQPIWQAQDGQLHIVHEDETMLILNKPAGLVMYPAAGNSENTLANFLLGYDCTLHDMPRAGIVHRLDKDTSGLLVVAKTLAAHTHLVAALQARTIHRHYQALVYGMPDAQGKIETQIGRHPIHRQRQAVRTHGGKLAVTHYQRERVLPPCTFLAVKLDTGRTHQIRVHMSHIGHSIVGDATYKAPVNWRLVPLATRELLLAFPRQALHAARLVVPHQDGSVVDVTSALPDDMVQLIAQLVQDEPA